MGQQSAKLPIITDPVYAKPQRRVDMDHGRRMNLYCRGSGSPTVVFDSGMGDSTISWAMVQPALSKRTRTCSYDRAGLGFSDAATRPGTVRNMAEDLHALLQAAHIEPPYVLVGHSAAGMTVRVFADRYRDEVVGMVVVEGSHEDQSTRSWAIEAPGSKEKWDASLKTPIASMRQRADSSAKARRPMRRASEMTIRVSARPSTKRCWDMGPR
jgi:pimeloyl-ACP methyl ester carboxylesterase